MLLVGIVSAIVTPLHALTISGSDLFGEAVQEALEAELTAAGLEVDIAFNGSLLGLRDLEAGTVDVSLLAIPDGGDSGRAMRRFPIAYQVVTCAVHFTNPVRELTYEQLVNLYGDNGTLEDWSELTTDPAWADRKVTLAASRRNRAVTLELFKAIVLEGASLKSSVRFLDLENEGLLAAIMEDPTILLLAPAIEPDSSVNLLAVKESAADQGYTPSVDNVFFGDYPLRLPFYLVVPDSIDDATVGKLLRAVFSEPVTLALSQANCMPVPEPEQRSILSQFK